MIFTGKKMRDALTGKEKPTSPAIRIRFDTEKELFHRKDDTKPLFAYRLKGDFRISLLHLAVALITAAVGLCVLCKTLKKKK